MSGQKTAKSIKCINTFTLKLIAIISMTIDHIGVALGTTPVGDKLRLTGIFTYDTYYILRYIGRLAFPIFCYQLIEGFYHTKNVRKYLLRLFIFALISQVPFSLSSNKTPFNFSELNVFFTLFMGLACVFILDSYIRYLKEESGLLHNNQYDEIFKDELQLSFKKEAILYGILSVAGIFAIMFLSVFLSVDYDIFGISLILIFYIFRGQQIKILIAMLLAILIFSNKVELYALASLIPIFLHNGKKGPSLKYGFYAYYPFHLTVLYFIYTIVSAAG